MADASVRVLPAAFLAAILIAGIAIAGYLAVHHENHVYGDATLSLANCPETETVNCDVVNSSAWSELAGVPIAAFAVPTYLLLLGLLVAARRDPGVLAYVFTIGLLTVAYSVFLFVVSKIVVGFLCLWCIRLYSVNLSIPILSALAAHRSPASLLASSFKDIRRFRPAIVRSTAAFVVLLGLTVAGDHAWRTHVRAEAAAERRRIEREGGPTVPAVPEPASGSSLRLPSLVPPAYADEKAPEPYKLAGPLRRVDGATSAPFDLQARLGKGKPVALLFWAPNFAWSERTLVAMSRAFARDLPQFEVYAVSGRRDDQKDEDLVERFAMLDVPPGLHLLADDAFAVSKALAVEDVPNVAVFSAKGRLVVAKIKSPDQLLITQAGNKPAEEVLELVAKGVEVPQIQRMFPYYPASELVGHCAPPFRAKTFGTGTPFAFAGKGSAGRPTLVMFWSSTCKHCQVDVPQLVKWVRAHPGAVDVVGVTILKKEQAGQPSHRAITEAYMKAQGIPWTVVEDPDGVVTRTYRAISTPTTFFVSPSGTVTDVWYYAHEEGFDAAIERSLTGAKATTQACTAPTEAERPALAMSVLSQDGKRVELAKAAGGPALVHFWATWCKPCVAELPSLVRFRDAIEKAGAGKVVLVSVEGEGDGKRIAAFQKTLGVDLHSYRAPQGGVAAKVDPSFRVPRTYVVDAKGGVLEERQGAQDWADPAVAEGVKAWLDAAR